tara:strand:+ start:1402 stop:2319 length:918 start_codon:yes stop_codon:yes gene_type:complete
MNRIQPLFNKYIENKEGKLSKNTILTYTNMYKKLYNHFGEGVEPAEMDEELLIDAINKDMIDDKGFPLKNPNTKTALFNTIIIVKKEHDLAITRLLKAKEALLEDIYDHREAQKIIKANTLATYKQLKTHLKMALQNEDYESYIINFLMQNFFTRNKDLDIYITTSLKQAKDPTKNYLVIRNWDLIYIKNIYKTAKTYGSMRFDFRDKKLTYALQKFIESKPDFADKYEWRLMSNAKGEDLDESSQAKFIRKHTLNGISESDVFKIRVDDMEKRSDLKGLLEASRRRGTNINTVINNYSLKNISV